MKNKNQIQQGDVLFQRVSQLPKGCLKLPEENGKLIIARGEQSGHHHAITTKEAVLWELEGDLYLEATAPVTITHEEHKALEIPEGIYKIGRVKEYDYFTEMEHQVRD